MKSVSLPLLLVLIFTSAWPVGAADTSERQQLYYWLWAKNMEGYWQDFSGGSQGCCLVRGDAKHDNQLSQPPFIPRMLHCRVHAVS